MTTPPTHASLPRRTFLAGAAAFMLGAAAPARRFETQLEHFGALDAAAPSPEGSLLFIGSSTIRLWPDLEAAFQPWPVVQRGFGGATLGEIVDYAPRLLGPHRPAATVLYAGENDLAEGADPAMVAARFQALQAYRRRLGLPSPLLFVAPKPSPARLALWPAMQATTAAIAHLPEADLPTALLDPGPLLVTAEGRLRPEMYAPDGVHLGPLGYERLEGAVRAAIRPWLHAAEPGHVESAGRTN